MPAVPARDRFAIALAVVCLLSATVGIRVRRDDTPAARIDVEPIATRNPTQRAEQRPPAFTSGIAVTLRPVIVRSSPSLTAPAVTALRAGVALPVTELRDGWLAVMSPCERAGWIHASDATGQRPEKRRTKQLGDYTFVLDPGHSVSAPGAVGPTKLTENEVNFDIVQRIVERLARPPGRQRPPRVLVTHGPDHDAGLAYRTALANGLGADALVSVHNNAAPDRASDSPGTETYYQIKSSASKRLAGLIYEELVNALSKFEGVAWMAENDAGAKFRRATSGPGDYYAILRRTRGTSVLVEAAFISNAPEEAILRSIKGRDAIAKAITAGIVRWATTNAEGSGFVTPYPREPGPSGALPSSCKEPA